jgi:hypothetical protein
LGSAFAAVTGTGFPATSPAVVTGATPQGTTTINVTTDSRGQIATSVPIPDGYQGSLDMRATVGSAAATATLEAGSGAGEEPAKDAGVRPLARRHLHADRRRGVLPDRLPRQRGVPDRRVVVSPDH